MPKKAVLMMTYADAASSQAAPVRAHYDILMGIWNEPTPGRGIVPGAGPGGPIDRTRIRNRPVSPAELSGGAVASGKKAWFCRS